MAKKSAKPKKPAKWREFEELVKKIYAQATPEATVRHNYFILGKSGSRRQIDVSIEARQGLHNYLTVVECKDYARPVGIGDVDAFATKIRDVRADKGVMVSSKGFDEGARGQAKENNITLFSYRQASETDWHQAGSASIWFRFTTETFRPEYMIAQLAGGGTTLIGVHEEVFTAEADVFTTGTNIAASLIEHHPFLSDTPEAIAQRGPGPMWLEGRIGTDVGPFFLKRDGELLEIERVVLQGSLEVLEYSVNPAFESGHVIEDAFTGAQPYTEVTSLPFRPEAVMRTQEGRLVTMEEYRTPRGVRFMLPPEARKDTTEFRITITSPNAGKGSV